jgi:uncharacterized membrane protein
MSHELVLGIFPADTEKAVAQLDRYKVAEDELGIAEALAIVKPKEGKDKVHWIGDRSKAKKIGAVAGAMLGLLGGPATMVVVGLGGAAAGGLIDSLSHAGISKKTIEAVENGLEPGSSAVLVIVQEDRRHVVIKDLKNSGATVHNQSIESHEIEGKLMIQPSSGISETQ